MNDPPPNAPTGPRIAVRDLPPNPKRGRGRGSGAIGDRGGARGGNSERNSGDNNPERNPEATSERTRGSRGKNRNRNRGPRDSDRNQTRSNRDRNRTQTTSSPVPKNAQLRPGTPVSIVLKIDQPTGRQVQGLVAEVLTRGDHHRGVKVRLQDGRVGRVQSIVDNSSTAVQGGAGAGPVYVRTGVLGIEGGGTVLLDRPPVMYRHTQDVRSDGYLYDEEVVRGRELGIFGALEEADRKAAAEKKKGGGGSAKCPVCGTFEGDEVAVARHVEGHFGEGEEEG